MESKFKILGHPVHPILIVYPLGLLSTAVIFDLIAMFGGNAFWYRLSFWMIAAGIIGGLLAAVFGIIDWIGIPRTTRAYRIGLLHGAGNVVVVLLFVGSWLMRRGHAGRPGSMALTLSFLGVLLALGTGWLGGELVYRLGLAVDEGANMDASNSMSGRPAHDVSGNDVLKEKERNRPTRAA